VFVDSGIILEGMKNTIL